MRERDSITKITYTSDDFDKELPPVQSKKEMMQIRTKPLRAIVPRQFPDDGRYVDLEPYYNFSLSEEIHGKPGNTIPIPSGINDFNGVNFDARGIIQLASKVSLEMSHINYPKEISGIPVHHMADELCFLHSSAWESETGTEVVRIVVNYADNRKKTITIRSRIEVEDWWFHPKNSVFPPRAELAWEGSNPRVKDLGFVLKLYRYTWENPRPDVEIRSIDLISAMNDTGYMLYGVTCL